MKRFLLLLIIVLSCCLSWAQDWVSKYDEVGVFENDRAYVRLKKKYGYVDSNGKEVIPCTYSSVGAFNEHGIVWVNKDGKYGIYNHDGKVILPVKYDAVSFFQRDRRSEDGNPYYMFRTLSNVESDNSRYSKNIDGKLFVNDKGLKWVGKGCGKFGIYSPSNNTVLKPFEKLSTDE